MASIENLRAEAEAIESETPATTRAALLRWAADEIVRLQGVVW